ncbi:tubulin binding cofactor C-domain-containing protein [Tirmania nivea]|nr:tubulin binding cofactor C-domain-containing protein [Tirmania nivea]
MCLAMFVAAHPAPPPSIPSTAPSKRNTPVSRPLPTSLLSELHLLIIPRPSPVLDGLIDNLSILPASQHVAAIDDCLLRINHLSDKVKDATSYIPPYDQRKYSEHIKALSDKLSHARKALAPKQKFSFKSKAKPSSSTLSSSNKPTPAPTPSSAPAPITTQNYISIASLTSKYIQPLSFPQSSPVSLSSLNSSFINLFPSSPSSPLPSMLAAKDITTSILFAPHVSGPAHLTSIHNSIVILNCAQFRMHDTHATHVYLLCPSRPIIEDCSGIKFAPLPVEWIPGGLREETNMVGRKNMWDQVDDFKWLRAEHSPNWSVMPEGEKVDLGGWQQIMEIVGKTAVMVRDRGDGVMRADMNAEKVLGIMKNREAS